MYMFRSNSFSKSFPDYKFTRDRPMPHIQDIEFCTWDKFLKISNKVMDWCILISNRRQRTMAIETFNIINKIAPSCLSTWFKLHTWSNTKYSFRYSNILEIPQVRTSRYGKMSFKFAAATLWNSFPNHFRTENSFSQFKSLIQSWNGSVCRCFACRYKLDFSCFFAFCSACMQIMQKFNFIYLFGAFWFVCWLCCTVLFSFYASFKSCLSYLLAKCICCFV